MTRLYPWKGWVFQLMAFAAPMLTRSGIDTGRGEQSDSNSWPTAGSVASLPAERMGAEYLLFLEARQVFQQSLLVNRQLVARESRCLFASHRLSQLEDSDQAIPSVCNVDAICFIDPHTGRSRKLLDF